MRRGGFTILELSLVLAVIIVIAAISVPNIDAMYSDVKLSAAADLVRSRWAEARARAVEDGIPYRFAVTPNSGSFRVELETPDEAAMSDGDTRPLSINDTLPGKVVFASADATGDNTADGMQTVAVFLPDGTARGDVEVVFKAGGTRGLVLKLRALTGAVTSKFEMGR
ncbi:MAG: hypothetical protein K1X57_00265 [Gemmataceae bacterium]|nr:hypothetical protein [Gemmataceae bacterium]